jgi:dihydroxyacetone kinase
LGSMTALEMNIVARCLLSGTGAGKITHVVGPSALVTALDMHGFSATLLPITKDIATALSFAVEPKSWPGLNKIAKPKPLALQKLLKTKSYPASASKTVSSLIVAACDQLIAHESQLNELDSKIGDGDTGSTIATAARALKGDIDNLPLAQFDLLCSAISARLLAVMGGSSGVLLAILFAASSAASSEGRYWTVALLEGLSKLKEYGGARLGDRTMVDALEPALRALSQGKTLAFATDLARQGADGTAHMKNAAAGRASYVPTDNLNGVIDPGAEAVAILFEALNNVNQKGL